MRPWESVEDPVEWVLALKIWFKETCRIPNTWGLERYPMAVLTSFHHSLPGKSHMTLEGYCRQMWNAGNIWTLCFQLCLSRSFWSLMKSKHRWQTFCPSLLVWIIALDSKASVRLAHFGCWIVQSRSWKFLVTFLQGSPAGVSSKEKSEYAAYSSQSGRKSCRAQKYRNYMK